MNTTARLVIPSALLSIFLSTFPTSLVHSQSTRNLASHPVRLNVAEVAVLALNDPNPLSLVVVPRSLIGVAFASREASRSEGSRKLNYTTVNAPGATRAILVQWAAGDSAPPGTSLKIAATHVPDRCGLAAPEVTVGNIPQSLITGIPSCTTDAVAGGAVLRYRLNVDDEMRIVSGAESEVSIIFTLLDR
jgi:hypothetical protein